MKFEAECRELRHDLGGEASGRVEATFIIESATDGWPGCLIIRMPDDGGLDVGCTVALTVEREGADEHQGS